eukprot:194439_1
MIVWQETIQIIRELLCICFMTVIIIAYVRAIHTTNNKNRLIRWFNILILITFIMYLGQLTFALISMFFTEWICIHVIPITPPWYFISKGCYYSVFVLRLRIIFGDAAMAYPKKHLVAIVVFDITFTVIMALWAMFEQIFLNQYIYYDAENEYCYAGIPIYIVAIFAVWDFTMSGLLLYLFIAKLKKLVGMMEEHVAGLRRTMLKSTVLAVTAIVSTFIFLVGDQMLAPKDLDGWIYIDLVINSVCLLLMKTSFDRYYETLCHFPQKCVIRCCAKQLLPTHKVGTEQDINEAGSQSSDPQMTQTI